MTITASDVITVATEFASVETETIELYMAQAANQMNASAWGSKYDNGQIYLTAHLLVFAENQNSDSDVGPVSSQAVGPLNVSYGISGYADDGELASTSYGRKYLTLQKSLFSNRMYGWTT